MSVPADNRSMARPAVRPQGLLLPYGLLSLLVTATVTVALVIAAEIRVSRDLLAKDRDIAEQAVGFLWNQIREHHADRLPSPDHVDTDGLVRDLDYVVGRFRALTGAAAINLIAPDGRVVYSTIPEWKGKVVDKTDLLRRVLDGEADSELLEAGAPLDLGGMRDVALLEAHVRGGELTLPDGTRTPIVVEVYQPADAYLEVLTRSRWYVILIALCCFSAMFLAHLWLFLKGHRTIAARTRELELLSGTLEEQVQSRTRQLATSRRLADVGKLAAGVAHEINTPLASIAASAEGLLRRTADPALTEPLEIIRREAFRVKAITRSLLDFSRLDQTPPDPDTIRAVRLQETLTEARSLMGFDLEGHGVRFVVDVDDPDLTVRADPAALHQIVLALTSNAIDALPDGGDVTWEARSMGEVVRLRCIDHGVGISSQLLDNVLDPFVTSKDVGQGTGLGLSVAYSLARRQAGTLTVDSPGPGLGTVASLFLPTGVEDRPTR